MGRRSRRCRRGSGQRAALAAALRTFYSVTGAKSCNATVGILRAYRIDAQWSAVAPTIVLAWFAAQDADGGIRAPIYPLSHCKTCPSSGPFSRASPRTSSSLRRDNRGRVGSSTRPQLIALGYFAFFI